MSRRENHDSSNFYARGLVTVAETKDRTVDEARLVDDVFVHSAEQMKESPDNSVALILTSPPYHVGKDYDADTTFEAYLDLLEAVFRETYPVRSREVERL